MKICKSPGKKDVVIQQPLNNFLATQNYFDITEILDNQQTKLKEAILDDNINVVKSLLDNLSLTSPIKDSSLGLAWLDNKEKIFTILLSKFQEDISKNQQLTQELCEFMSEFGLDQFYSYLENNEVDQQFRDNFNKFYDEYCQAQIDQLAISTQSIWS